MKKSLFILIALTAGIFTGGFLIVHSSDQPAEKPACKEAAIECCDKKNTTPSKDGMIWETFSREFLSYMAIPIDFQVK